MQAASSPTVLRTVPASDFAAENNSQDCFLYAAHPLGVRIPFAENKKTEASSDDVASVLARCKGFEPLTFWFVAKHSIQLS